MTADSLAGSAADLIIAFVGEMPCILFSDVGQCIHCM